MRISTIGVIGAGDMGSAVGRALIAAGYRVVTDLSGRSAESHVLATSAGMEDLGSLASVLAEAELLLSIMPPSAADGFADRVIDIATSQGTRPIFADCNAISPMRVRQMADRCSTAGIPFIDVGIIGLPPGKTPLATRFFASGPRAGALAGLATSEIEVRIVGDSIGRASAIKMTYAAETKGVYTLHMALLLTAARLGVLDELIAELQYSKPAVWNKMQESIPFIAADAERWVGEMVEIADTFRDQGITPGFHEGAAWVFRQLAQTPLAAETRRTANRDRTVQEALRIILDGLTEH